MGSIKPSDSIEKKAPAVNFEPNRLDPSFAGSWAIRSTVGGVIAFTAVAITISFVGVLLDDTKLGEQIAAHRWPYLAVFLVYVGIALSQWGALRDIGGYRVGTVWWAPASLTGAAIGVVLMAAVYPSIWNDAYRRLDGPGTSGSMKQRGSFYNENIFGWGDEPFQLDIGLFSGESAIQRQIRSAETRQRLWKLDKPATEEFDVNTAKAMAWAWIVAATLFAIPVGVMQWVALRRKIPRFSLWVPATVVAALLGNACVGLIMMFDASVTGGTTSYDPPGLIGLLGMLLGSAVFSLITGAAMATLLRGFVRARQLDELPYRSDIG
ncbi:MAG: hypothetical protein QGG34_09475 [SAR202 cluster bacterium]|jgi:hypothetical protein|nr:hypothetical protein [SAR202 cluster bacterium]MDP6300158.1 hypothetical protein [SAR202 cluster bacterium]MDP7102898.1 hypothetical protein [SAR202 cluster bacterium]MDP7225793.1 hypothetical protein [SAR202 cluster bacterium]|tara:strand:- start:992 stop:1960 length:969 start_codon:yes stop_codon:yes gene_type:complete